MATHGYTRRHFLGFTASSAAMLMAGCGPGAELPPPVTREVPKGVLPPLFDDLQKRTFDFFWETTNPRNVSVALATIRRTAAPAGRKPAVFRFPLSFSIEHLY